MKRIGFIGLGDMGVFMSKNLIASGYPVKGFDISEKRLEQFAKNGGVPCGSSKDVGMNTDIVIIMVVTAEQAEAVLFGENGLLEKMEVGKTVIITSTIGEQAMRDIAAKAGEKGIHIVDCAVTGGQIGAEEGTLAMMAAAPKEVLDSCMEVLQIIGETIVSVGEEPGMGQAVKNCNGIMSAMTTIAVCEAMALGAKAGIAPQVLTQVIGNGVCGSPLFRNYAEKIMSRRFEGGGVQLKLLYKDTNLLMNMAKDLGVPRYATAVCNQVIHAAMAKYPNEDCWAPVKLYEEVSGKEVK